MEIHCRRDLVGFAATGCDVVPESLAPLSPPLESSHDPSIVGVWYSEMSDLPMLLHVGEREDGLLDALMILPASNPGEVKNDKEPIFWFRAVVHASAVDGVTYYNARRYAGMGADYTAPGEEPGYIIIRAEHRGGDTLALGFMSGDRVRELAQKGRIAARVLHGQLQGREHTYRMLEISSEELRELIREDPPDKLFPKALELQRLTRPEPDDTKE